MDGEEGGGIMRSFAVFTDTTSNFTKEEMSRLQQHISANTETITSLIAQTLLNSQRATDAGNSNEPEMPEP